MSSQQLRQKWVETFGVRPHNAYSCDYMRKRLSEYENYRQEKEEDRHPKRRKYTPRPGIKRTRRYKGEDHVVAEVEDGFEYRGKLYESYSAVAQRITGHRISGLHFFGVPNEESLELDENVLLRHRERRHQRLKK